MADTRRCRGRRLPTVVLAGLFLLALAPGAARAAPHGDRGSRHLGGFGGVAAMGPFQDFGSRRFAPRSSGTHRSARGRHHRRDAFFVPYLYGGYGFYDAYGFDEGHEDEAPASHDQAAAASPQHSGYCDVPPGTYPHNCVWEKGP